MEIITKTLEPFKKRADKQNKPKYRKKTKDERLKDAATAESERADLATGTRRRCAYTGMDMISAAKDQSLGSVSHKLFQSGAEIGFSRDQFETIEMWADLHEQNNKRLGVSPLRSSSDLNGSEGHISLEETNEDIQRSERVKAKYNRMRRAALQCGDPVGLVAVENIVAMDAMRWPSQDTIASARVALNAMCKALR